MSAVVQEWLNVMVRWAHVIAAIMWIGDSFLFMWLDSKLRKVERKLEGPFVPAAGDVVGELYMAHSGGFYEVAKYKSLPGIPKELHFFKWQSYMTWITGFLLLIIVYWAGGRAMLLDTTSTLHPHVARAVSLCTLVGGVSFYALLCRTPLIGNPKAFGVVGLGVVMAAAFGLAHVFTARATFLHIGAMVGTVMASNVFFIIIPAQRHMLAATRAGVPVDTSYGARAKQRSVHNHYATLPVLFTMLSNHFPGLYGHEQSWLVLGLVCVLGAGAKYVMNHGRATHPLVLVGTGLSFSAAAFLTIPQRDDTLDALASGDKVSFATAQHIITTRCVSCHAVDPANPAFAAPPEGVVLETPAQIAANAERILVRAVQTETMPLGNMTGMTQPERKTLGAWILQGADINAPGPVALPAVASASAAAPASTAATLAGAPPGGAASAARVVFANRCALCHGAEGKGDGAAGQGLEPRPRNFTDAQWQASTDDANIRRIILEGGPAVGMSAAMPPAADLAAKPEVFAALVAHIRSFGHSDEAAADAGSTPGSAPADAGTAPPEGDQP